MALPFQPAQDIPAAQRPGQYGLATIPRAFPRAASGCSTECFDQPPEWTVYSQTVRTNNDVVYKVFTYNFYQNCIKELYDYLFRTLLLIANVRMASPGKCQFKACPRRCSFFVCVCCCCKRPSWWRRVYPVTTRAETSEDQHRKLEEAWNRYDVGEISTGHFLRLCGSLYTSPATINVMDCVQIVIDVISLC